MAFELGDSQVVDVLRKRLEQAGVILDKKFEYWTLTDEDGHSITRRKIGGADFEDVEVGGDHEFKLWVWSTINVINYLERGEILDCSA